MQTGLGRRDSGKQGRAAQRLGIVGGAGSWGFAGADLALAAEASPGQLPNPELVVTSWGLTLAGAVISLIFAAKFFRGMVRADPGDPQMIRIADAVRAGARAYLGQQYRVILLFFIVVSALLAAMAFGLKTQSRWVPLAFWTGGFFSGLAGWIGMRTATLASSRTAQACKTSLNQGLQVAFRSGAVMGLTVVGLGLCDICLWFAILYWGVQLPLETVTVTMLCCVMGASSQALFARVGGGIFTKAADVGADLVGKVEQGIPEDDPRNPATIADNVGDNVGDVAGMGADLYESFAGSILAAAALGVSAFPQTPDLQMMCVLLPLLLAATGSLLSILGIHLVHTEEHASQHHLLHALARGINISTAGVIVATFGLVYLLLVVPSRTAVLPDGSPHPVGLALLGLAGSIIVGLVAGWLIGKWTEYSTSQEYSPTRHIADQSLTGPATVIIAGMAEGLYSVWVPVVVVCAGILLAFGFATGFVYHDDRLFALGLYGVAIAAVGMLSTLGITLATDAYGPIADNAGGNAEMSKLDPIVRHRTDALDSLGNTTAATGKGFAIGSAALTALALLAAYVEQVRTGLERWAFNSPAVAVSSSLEDATIRKLNPSLLVLRQSEADLNTLYLLNRTSALHPSADYVLSRDARVGADVAGVNVQKLVDDGLLISNRTATIPDYARYYDLSILNPRVLVGMFLGVMLVFVFCALTMKAVGRAAGAMVAEVRRQFHANAGIMLGTSDPDYAACVEISTKAAQREMVLPSVLALLVPVVVGVLLGVSGVVGMLAGGLSSGFAVAIMMANAGGAWDNAKKYIESGAHGGKGTEAHKATVVGDTVGDPFKDTSGPSLNILIKLMSIVSVVFAGLVVQYAVQIF